MKILFPLGLLVAAALLARPAAAATFTVTTTSDAHSQGFSGNQGAPDSANETTDGIHLSLRSALERASTTGGSTIINLPAGTYNLSLGDLVVGIQTGTTIFIHGMGTSANTIIHQSQAHRMVLVVNYNVNANVVFALDNVTVSGGNEDTSDPDGFGGNGGAILAGGSSTAPGNAVNLTNTVFSGNTAGGNANGGAISMSGGGDLNLVNCTFSNNHAGAGPGGSGAGGAIYFDAGFVAGNVLINNSTFASNLASGGNGLGGALYLASGNGNPFTLNQCAFTGNAAATRGGAIDLETGHLTASFNRFTGNTAPAGAGSGLFVLSGGSGWADARNNWWGGNGGPNTAGSESTFPTTSNTPPLSQGQIAFNPWLKLTHTASPAAIPFGGTATLTAGFTVNSAGTAISPSNLGALLGLPITFNNAVKGILSSPQTTIQASGAATAIFTGSAPGAGSADASVDNATVAASITVNQAATTTSVASSANPSASGQPVTFTATVSVLAPGAGIPTGTAQFVIDGSNFGSPVTLIGGVANSPASSTLTVAGSPHSVTAVYSGDSNFTTSTSTPPLAQTVIASPTAGPDTLGTSQNTPLNAPVAKLLANDSSPTAGPLSITAVTSPSTQGGTVALNGSFVTYTPAHNFIGTDTFTYTLSDTHATAQGTVTVTVSPDGQTLNTLSITGTPPSVTLTFASIPGQTYVVQWAMSANGPWTDFGDGTIVAGATGLVQYTDSTQPPPPSRFFRTRAVTGP